MNRAYLQARLLFFFVGLTLLIDPVIKLITAYVLVSLQQADYVYLAIPFSGLGAAVISIVLVAKLSSRFGYTKEELQAPVKFPKAFFGAALVTGLANNLFLTFDVLLVKHFFSAAEAGVYSLLSLIGKMIYFFGSLLNTFMLPLVTADLGAKRNPNKTFNIILLFAVGIVLGSVGGMIMFGEYLLPIAFGEKVSVIFPYITFYAIGIGAYTISSTILVYHLARKHFTFAAVSFSVAFLLVAGIMVFHSNISEVVTVILYLSVINLIFLTVLHIVHTWGVIVAQNLVDFACLFLPLPVHEPKGEGKKILIFNWRDTKHNYAGGAEVYIHELASRWIAMGHTVTWFCGNDEQCKRYETIDGIDVIRRGGFYTVYIWAFLYYIFRLRGKYDVILDCQNGIPFFTPLFVKQKVYCVMFHVHQKVFRESLSPVMAFIASYLEANLMPWAYRNVKFITISPSTKKDMQKIGMGKAGIEIVYPGVDTKFHSPGIKNKIPFILYVGRLKKYKSVDVFLKTIPQLKKKIKNAIYVVAGDGEEKKRLQALASRLVITDDVIFKGKITQEEKRDLYREAWVFVNPSMMEGWAITNIEASASGTVVVAADVQGMRDSVCNGKTGYLVEHGDITAFADKISSVVQDKELRDTMEKQSVQWAKKFEWDKSARKGINILVRK
jgi:glycosyltransferase involved in cell wall biosynthesis